MVKPINFYLLDTNTVSFVVTGRSDAARSSYVEAEKACRIAISSITEGEIRYGIAKKQGTRQERDYMEEFLVRTERLVWDSAAAAAYGLLRAQSSAMGVTLGALDMLIAAHAVAVGAMLVTHDRGMHLVNKLVPVTDWANDL